MAGRQLKSYIRVYGAKKGKKLHSALQAKSSASALVERIKRMPRG